MLLPSVIQRFEALLGIAMPIVAPWLAWTLFGLSLLLVSWPPHAARAIARPTTTSPVRDLRTVPPLSARIEDTGF
jgi:hypothetical protein